MGRYIPRNISSRTTGIGIMMLVILFMLAGQRTIPQLFSNFIPTEADCTSLRIPSEADRYQSLLQREASARGVPVRVRVRLGDLNPDGSRAITIVLTNLTVGTLPIHIPNDPVRNPNGFLNVSTPSTDGVGIVVNTPLTQGILPDTNTLLNDNQVRLLVPLQSCTISQTFTAAQLTGVTQGATVTGYYRNTTRGVLTHRTDQSIFTDFGLWSGQAVSNQVLVPPVTFSAEAGG
jgi:hypothetical protein